MRSFKKLAIDYHQIKGSLQYIIYILTFGLFAKSNKVELLKKSMY